MTVVELSCMSVINFSDLCTDYLLDTLNNNDHYSIMSILSEDLIRPIFTYKVLLKLIYYYFVYRIKKTK